MSGDVLAILFGVGGALALVWAATEVRGYVLWHRHGRREQRPDRWRLRMAVYSGLAVVGGILGLLVGGWLRG